MAGLPRDFQLKRRVGAIRIAARWCCVSEWNAFVNGHRATLDHTPL